MAVTKLFVISWQDTLPVRNNRAFKFKDTALKFSARMLDQGYNVCLTELEFEDAADLNVCIDNSGALT
jgi:hypothetical protein